MNIAHLLKRSSFVLVFSLLLFLVACKAQESYSEIEKPEELLDLDLSDFTTVLAVKENIAYGYRFLESGGCEFLTYNFSDGKCFTHGKADQFYISTDSTVFIGNTIFIPIASAPKESDYFDIFLFSFSKNSLCKGQCLYTIKSPLVFLETDSESIMTFYCDVNNDNQLLTCIDLLNVADGEILNIVSKSTDLKEKKGEQILAFDYSQGQIYMLVQNNRNEKMLKIEMPLLDKGSKNSVIDITNLAPEVTSQAISSFEVVQNLLYIKNFSDAMCLAKIQETKCEPLLYGDYEHQLILANLNSFNQDDLFFFSRNTNSIYSFSVENEFLYSFFLNQEKRIRNICCLDDGLLILLFNDTQKPAWEIVSFDNFYENSVLSIDTNISRPYHVKNLM